MRARLVSISTLALALTLGGCGSKHEPMTAQQVRAKYAQHFVDGVDYGLSGRIKARAIDPETNDLLDVTIEEIDKRMLHADRGELIVDSRANTLSIRLVGVTSADIESGVLDTSPMYLTEAIELGFDVID